MVLVRYGTGQKTDLHLNSVPYIINKVNFKYRKYTMENLTFIQNGMQI